MVGTGAPGHADALRELTPQQLQIVQLASDGLTNRQIARRLSLSPRTVGTHLYRSFPKLGVTDRHQLRDVIARGTTLASDDGVTDARRPNLGLSPTRPLTARPPRWPVVFPCFRAIGIRQVKSRA